MNKSDIMKAAEGDSVMDIIYKVPRCLERPNSYGSGYRAVTIKFLHSIGEWRIFISGYAPMYDKELGNLMRRYAQHIKENLSKGK